MAPVRLVGVLSEINLSFLFLNQMGCVIGGKYHKELILLLLSLIFDELVTSEKWHGSQLLPNWVLTLSCFI